MEVKKDKKSEYCMTWFYTWNNPPDNYREVIDSIESLYSAYQKEVGESGTPHIQGCIKFPSNKTLTAVKKLLPEAHWEITHDIKAASKYCTKEDTRVEGPYTTGILPLKRNSKTDWDDVLTKAKTGRIDEIPADIQVRCHHQLMSIAKNNPMPVPEISELDNKWLWGKTGTGKSRQARQENPGAYVKSYNKWWDGYTDETSVILDDFERQEGDKENPLAHHLKIWADHYPFQAEIKGGSKLIRPLKLVVTSNYPIHMCFKDGEVIEAIQRRFNEVEKK